MTARRLRWAGLLRLAAVVGIVAGFGGVLTGLTPRAAAGEPTATPFVRVRIDQVTPDVVTTYERRRRHRQRHGDQHR